MYRRHGFTKNLGSSSQRNGAIGGRKFTFTKMLGVYISFELHFVGLPFPTVYLLQVLMPMIKILLYSACLERGGAGAGAGAGGGGGVSEVTVSVAVVSVVVLLVVVTW